MTDLNTTVEQFTRGNADRTGVYLHGEVVIVRADKHEKTAVASYVGFCGAALGTVEVRYVDDDTFDQVVSGTDPQTAWERLIAGLHTAFETPVKADLPIPQQLHILPRTADRAQMTLRVELRTHPEFEAWHRAMRKPYRFVATTPGHGRDLCEVDADAGRLHLIAMSPTVTTHPKDAQS